MVEFLTLLTQSIQIPNTQVAAQRFVFLGAAEQPIRNMDDVASVLKKG